MARTVAQVPVVQLPPNKRGRDFVVADLHGCLEPLLRLLKHIQFDPERDRVFSVGDLTDRGPDSWGCLRLLKLPWFFAVLGNHDALLLAHLRTPTKLMPHEEGWLAEISPSLGGRKAFAQAWIEELAQLPAVYVVGAGTPQRFQVVHGELLDDGAAVTEATIDRWSFANPTKALERATYGRALINAWREGTPVRRAQAPTVGPIYCGHTIVPRACSLARQVYLDMGAFLGHTENSGLDEGEAASATPMREPGLVMIQAHAAQGWIAPTRHKQQVHPLALATLDTY